MKNKGFKGPWMMIVIALLLVVVIVVLGNQPLVVHLIESEGSAHLAQLLVVGLGILVILLGPAYAIVQSLRSTKFLEKELEVRAGELKESNERLRKALDSLDTAHAFLESVIDGVAEPIMVIGTDYHVKFMNQVARRFCSGDAGASELLLCHQVSHQSETPCNGLEHPCPLEEVHLSGQVVTVMHEHYQADGERRFVEIIAAPLWGADGTFQGIVEAARDITERKRAEEVIAQEAYLFAPSDDELGQFAHQVARSIQDMLAKAPSD
jgi:PAS domain-containing protein